MYFLVIPNGLQQKCSRHGNQFGESIELLKKLHKLSVWSIAFPIIFIFGTGVFLLNAITKYLVSFHDLPIKVWNDTCVAIDKKGD